jgi:hypothetical protein
MILRLRHDYPDALDSPIIATDRDGNLKQFSKRGEVRNADD